MKTIATIFGSAIGIIVIVALVIVLGFAGVWLNGQFQKAQNNADTTGRQTSQQYIQAEVSLMEGLKQDFYQAGCDKVSDLPGPCKAIIDRINVEYVKIDEGNIPSDLQSFKAQYGGRG